MVCLSVARRKDAFQLKQLLQKKVIEQLEMMPQERIPEAALSVHVCHLNYRFTKKMENYCWKRDKLPSDLWYLHVGNGEEFCT